MIARPQLTKTPMSGRKSIFQRRLIVTAQLSFMLLSCMTLCLSGEALERSPAPSVKLYLQNNDLLVGEVRDSEKPGVISFQSPLFTNPFEFPVGGIQKLEFSENKTQDPQDRDYSFELSGGDVLFGKLLSLGPEEMEIDASGFGRLHLQTSRLRRIARGVLGPDGTRVPELVYLGPNGLDKWEQLNDLAKASEENGVIVLDKPGASVSADVGLPLKAIIECELAWKAKSEFLFAFGVSRSDSSVKNAFGLEVWEKDLVARRETDTDADVASVAELKPEDSSIHLLIFLNRIEGRMQVFSSDGKQLADLEVRDLDPRLVTGVRFTNKTGEVRLQRLRVSNWSGELVPAVAWEKPRIHKVDGSLVLGRPEGFDAATSEFIIKSDSGESRIPIDQIANIFVPAGDAPKLTGMRLQLTNGTRISGELLGVRDASLVVQPPGIREPLSTLLVNVHSLNALERSDRYPEKKGNATLKTEGAILHGWLEESNPDQLATHGPLIWHPEMSSTAGYFKQESSARIEISKSKVSSTGKQATSPSREVVDKDILGFDLPRKPPQAAVKPKPTVPVEAQPCLYLVSGDTIPCNLTRIDEKGIGFHSSMTSSTFVPHELIQAVVLVPLRKNSKQPQGVQHNFPPGVRIMNGRVVGPAGESTPGDQQLSIDAKKRERLLTLPRMQKSNPPTHLVCARNGDFLRGRIIEMNDQTLRIELRLETREIPRDRISKIIWLHPEKLTEQKSTEDKQTESVAETSPPANPDLEGIRIHVVRSNGIRLTFNALKVDQEKISGINKTLGSCEAPFDEIGEVLIGSAIETAAAETAFQQFKLQMATEPLPPPEGGSGGSGERTGQESPLVGKDAPEIKLELLAGGEFDLKDKRGRIVLIDFWASWCGPCRQTLPLVHTVADEYRDRGVELVTINLEESPKQITAAMERLKLNMPVAMDYTGKVGGTYGVSSIPNTIIIDKSGKVVRVFVGASDDFDEELRKALGEILGDVKPDNVGSPAKEETENTADPANPQTDPPTN